MRYVGNEPLLHLRQPFELFDLALQAGRHVVERGSELSEIILPLHANPLGEEARREAARRLRCCSDRGNHLSSHEPGDERKKPDEEHSSHDDGASHEVECLLLLSERKQVVQLIRPDSRDDEWSADNKPWRCWPVEESNLRIGP